MKVFLFILRNLGEYKTLFYVVVVAGLINGLATFYIPVSLAEFANEPLAAGALANTAFVVVGLYVLSLIVSYIIRGRGEALSKNFANVVRLKYFRELSMLPLGILRKKHSVYMQSLVNRVADGIGDLIFALFWNLLPGALLLILFFAYMAQESLSLALLNFVILTSFVITSSLLARKMIPIAAEQNRRNAVLLGSYADFMANIATVVQLGVRSYSQTTLHKRVVASNQQTDTLQQFHARRWFLLHTLFGLAYLSTITFLVWQIANGTATIGLLILFVSAYGLLRAQIESLSENVKSYMEIKAYFKELDDTLSQLRHDGGEAKTTWRRFTMQNVIFKHPQSKDALQIPDFSLEIGQKVCIEGKSGQGKSTLLGLLMNAYQPQGGVRLIDGRPFESVKRDFFEKNIAVIAQEAELFHLSLRDNLTLGKRVSDERLLDYLKKLEMQKWFDSLENGLDSIIGEKGVTLSAGQRQRLNILRAVILDRSLYLLDEPTSHLDEHTEEVVIAFLRKNLANKTAIIVTHRPALRSLCDTSYVMKNHRLLRT